MGELSVDARARIADYDVAQVLAVDRGRATVLLDDGAIVPAAYAGTMRGDKVVVGDRVRVRPARHDNDLARVADRLARDSELLRTADDDLDDERVVAANVDQVAVVLGLDHLDGGVGFADRVLVAASVGGLDQLVVLNKVDVAEAPASAVERFLAAGADVLVTSAATGEGLDDLRARLAGTWTALTGHSGVGKTSLFNRLVPDEAREVGEIGTRGGRHTTTSSLAVPVPGVADTWLVDTPGVRSFGLGAVRADELHRHFAELADLDWVDVGVIGDPVPPALVDRIRPDRLDAYRRLFARLEAGTADIIEQVT